MMSVSPAKNEGAPSTKRHPRRLPAHLSVSLRHESPPSAKPAVGWNSELQDTIIVSPKVFPTNESSDDDDEGSSGLNVQRWFDHSNKHPKVAFSQCLEGDEPPYFLPHNSSNASNEIFESRTKYRYGHEQRLKFGMLHSATNDSSTDDFRSVIDDLTVANKKLKEKLRKYERPHTPHLEKDRLFEVKIHGLPARKRRELEDTLRAFASSLDEPTDGASSKIPLGDTKRNYLSANFRQKHSVSSSNSNSRPVDSAYASMSNSGPTSTSNLNPVSLEGNPSYQTGQGKEQNIQSFLHNIPEGLLPKHSSVMTDRQKKRLVVQRLEQLFTGKSDVTGRVHSQPHQQQEVSQSAARADRAAASKGLSMEGVREANMLPSLTDVESRLEMLTGQSSNDTQPSRDISDSSEDYSPNDSELEQRPTRPLDLDPDRAQIPSENVEYIRHLGLSTPQLVTEDSADAAADAQGWIYLNLLTNMAQLHMINVTPDFVRHAVQDGSEKFQLSRDGNKIRWRGGSRGTWLSSSDSGTSSALNQSPLDSDSIGGGGKRRKVDVGRFASIPINVQRSHISPGICGSSKPFHYKPLFNHRDSSSGDAQSSDESDFRSEYGAGNDSGIRGTSCVPRTWSGRSRSGSQGSRRRDDGPMTFYSGAKFCTDLSGDREISHPLHITGVGEDDPSNHGRDALGCGSKQNAPPISRTTSGSTLPFRPFKAQRYTQSEELRSKTPDILTADSSEDEFFVDESLDSSGPSTPLQVFDASGLGGTQPADHFAVRVETRRTKTLVNKPAKLSRFSVTSFGSRKFYHTIPKPFLDSFVQPEAQNNAETITAHLASLAAFSSPSPVPQPALPIEELPIKTEFLSARFVRLEPSQLPAPSGYYGTSSNSDDESEFVGPSSASSFHLRRRNFPQTPHMSITDPDTLYQMSSPEKEQYSSDVEDYSDEEDESSDEE